MASNPVRVIVWDEAPGHANKTIYPNSLNSVIAAALNLDAEIVAVTANQDEPNQGITQEALDNADVLIWWGHARHNDVTDETAELVKNAVLKGMGFIALHSAHYSKTFKSILGCTGHLGGGWREGDPPDTEEITVCAPRHPIRSRPCCEPFEERLLRRVRRPWRPCRPSPAFRRDPPAPAAAARSPAPSARPSRCATPRT